MSNGILTATSPSPENLSEYDKSYEEWLAILRSRNSKLDIMPDPVVLKYGQNMYPKEASRVQSPEDYFFEEEKATRWLDDEGFIGRFLDESVQFVAQKAYNDGLGGMFDMIEAGETPYPLIDKRTGKPYDFNLLQNMASFVGSFVSSPIDIATMGGGTFVGKLIGKGILKGTRAFALNKYKGQLIKSGFTKESAISQASKRVAEKFSDKHLSHVLKKGWKETIGDATVELIKPQPIFKIWSSQGAPIAGALSAYHAVGAAAEQQMQRGRRGPDGKWIPGEFQKEDIPGILKEGAVGFATGYVLAGLQVAKGINIVGKSKHHRGMLHVGEFAGEVSIFGSVPNLLRGQLPNLTDEGELVWTEDGIPVQFQDEEGNLKNYSVYEGMKHSLFAIASLKGWHNGVNGISRYIGKRVRERTPEIIKLKKERDIIVQMENETASNLLKTELNEKKNEIDKKVESLEKENIEGFDESSYENIKKIDDAINHNKEPKKDWIDKAEVELENIKEHLHKKRSELEKGEELSPEDKDLAQAMNRVKEHIDHKREQGWIDDRDSLIDKGKSDADKRADLKGEFEAYLDLVKEGKEPKWKTIEEVLAEFDGNIDNALTFFAKYFNRKSPQSSTDTESNKLLKEILTNQQKEKADPFSKKSIEEAEGKLGVEAVDIIDADIGISNADKGALKVLLNKMKYRGGKSKADKITMTNLIGETRAFSRWLNGKGKTLKDATQKLFNEYIGDRGLAVESKRRYERQFETLGLDIDVSAVKVSIPKEKVILTTGEYQKNISRTEKKLEGEGDVNISPQVAMPKSMARIIMNLKSRWGHRDNVFKRTAKNGGVTKGDVEVNPKGEPYGIWVTEKGGKKVFRFLEPELIKDVKSLMEGKNKGDLLFSLDGKNPLSKENMENFTRNFISYGKEGVTGHKMRHFLITAAKELDKINKGKTNFTEFVDRFLLLHRPGAASDKLSPSSKNYILGKRQAAEDFATFQQFMEQLKTTKDVDLNKAFTKAERERLSEEIAAIGEGEKVKPPELKEIVKGSGAAFDRLTQKTKKGIVDFNDRDPNYSLKDKLADASLVGAEIIAQGTKNLKDFTTAMVERFGTSVQKYARQLYESSSRVLAESPERLAPKLMEKMGIKPEDIKFDVPEIEAEKIIKRAKEQKYDDTEVTKKIIRKKIEKVAYEKGLTDAKLNDEVFKSLGFYDKNGKPSIEGIKTESDLTDVTGFIKENFPNFREQQSLEMGKMIQDAQKNTSSTDKEWKGFLGYETKSYSMGVSRFIRKYGGAPGKWLSKKIDGFTADYQDLVGFGDSVTSTVKKHIGGGKKDLNMMALMDKEAFSTRLTIEQERFQHDMFNVPDSPQYKAREAISFMLDSYIDILMKRLKEKANPRDYERISKELKKKLIKDYFTRRTTKEASEYYEHNDDGRSFVKKAIRKQLYKDVVIKDKEYLSLHNQIRKLNKKLKDKDVSDRDATEKEIQKLTVKRESRQKELTKDKTVNIRMEKFYDQLRYNPDKLIHPNLDFVRLDLPEFIPSGRHAGKRTHSMNWEDTVGGYIESSSKFIAAITHFPSLTSWGGKKFKTPLESQMLSLYAAEGKAFSSYVEKQIKNLVVGSNSIEHKGINRLISGWTAYSSINGLSGFFSGIKNYQIADIMNFAAWGFGSGIKGYSAGWTAKGWEDARRVGAFQAGSKHLHEIGLNKPVMKYLSLMEPAEFSNRARAKATMFFWMQDALRFLRGERTLWLKRMGSEKWVRQKLRDTVEMEDKDIEFFKKYGLDSDLIPMDTPNYDKVILKHESMMRFLNMQSHRVTQGMTSVGDLPAWANKGFGKYSTLFYRMAFAGSGNTNRNVFKPLILKNPLPLVRLISMGLGHGTLLWQMKHALMGTERNNEHIKGETVDKLWESALAVETFSLFGSTIDALDVEEGRGIWQEFTPVIITNAKRLFVEAIPKLYDIFTNGHYTKTAKIKAYKQTFVDYAKQTNVAYNHWSKIRDNLFSGSTGKEIVRYRQASRIIRQFKNEEGIITPGGYSWDTPLYKALEREVLLADDSPEGQQIAAELYWVARMEMREKIQEESEFQFTQREADKLAKDKIDTSIKNRLGVIPFSMNSKSGRIKRGQLFRAVDKKGVYILRKAEDDSKKRLLNFWKQVNAINTDNRYTYW